MKKLLTEWRKFLKEGARQPWLSQSPSPELAAAIADNHERSQQHLCDIGRPLDSCDANTDFWLKALSDAGFDARDVRDGLFDDGGEMVGHDWIVINDNGSEIIFDAAAEQFDTEPFADKYTEVWAARQPKRENKAMKITESKLRLLVREEISKILKEVGRDPLGRMDEPTPRINPRAQKMLYDLIKHEEQALKSKDLDAVKKYGRLIARVLRDIGEFDDAPNYLKEGKIEKIPDPEEVSVGAEIENLPYSGSEIDDPDADEWQGDPGKRPSFNKEYWEKDKKLFNQAIQKILNQDDQHLVDMGFTPKEIQRLRARHVEGLFAGDFDMAQMAYGKMEPEEPYGGDSNLVEKKKKARS